MSEDFDLDVRRRDGVYVLVAPAFGVVVRNTDLAAGLQEARARIDLVAASYEAAGLPPPGLQQSRERTGTRLADHLPLSLVIGGVLSLFLLVASMPLFSAIGRLNYTLERVSLAAANAKIDEIGFSAAKAVIRLGEAMDKVTPQRKEELRQAVRKIMNGLAPIIEEVGDSGEPKAPTPPSTR